MGEAGVGAGEEGRGGEAFEGVLARGCGCRGLYHGGWGQGGVLVEMACWSTAVRVQSSRLKHGEK